MFKNILYIGSGLHVDVLKHFENTNNFVFIDSQPKNEYGLEYYYRPFYKEDFVKILQDKLSYQCFKKYDKITFSNNFQEINKKDLDSSCIYFYNRYGKNLRSEKSLKYFISTNIPNDIYKNKYLELEISQCNTVIVSGHDPHQSFVNFINKPFYFIGYSDTYYPKKIENCLDNLDKDSIISYILQNPDSIISYTHVCFETGKKNTFKSYNDFYKYTIIHNKEKYKKS